MAPGTAKSARLARGKPSLKLASGTLKAARLIAAAPRARPLSKAERFWMSTWWRSWVLESWGGADQRDTASAWGAGMASLAETVLIRRDGSMGQTLDACSGTSSPRGTSKPGPRRRQASAARQMVTQRVALHCLHVDTPPGLHGSQ